MGNPVVIVALPSLDDKVYKISSEKVPHLTLVSLGDQFTSDQLINIVQFTEHASAHLSPFGLNVDYRGTLGPKDADVVFFDKDGWSYPRISEYRGHLLQEDSIRAAYEASDQYPEWTPHLTLGFPETPAHEDTAEYPGINYVQFDRIAVWIDDSDGPTFRLKYENAMSEVAMSALTQLDAGENAARELFHYGKKGMKWGVTTVDKASKPTLTREKDMKVLNTKDVTVTQRRAGSYVKTRGGQRHKATDDAVKAAAARQKAKKSTTDSLTNDELKAAVDRMNLEQQYQKLDAKTKRRGQGFISQLFQSQEGRNVTADLAKRVATKA